MKVEFDPQADAVYLELTEAEVEEPGKFNLVSLWITTRMGESWVSRCSR